MRQRPAGASSAPEIIGNEPCMLTHGDGLADIDLDALLTLTAVAASWSLRPSSPAAPFGELEMMVPVSPASEKPQL